MDDVADRPFEGDAQLVAVDCDRQIAPGGAGGRQPAAARRPPGGRR